MKRKFILILAAVAAGAALGHWFNRPAPAKGPPAPVAIQDHKTIDFSSGRPVVKDSASEQAIIDAAVKEMDEAAKHVRFDPHAPPPTGKKPAETASPPKQ
jgi:hypothetical protein